MVATGPRPSGRRRTSRAADPTAATAVVAARSTFGSMPARRRLRDFNHRHHFRATPGGRGTRARRHGKAGDDLILDVPPGTAVYDDETGELRRRPRRGRPERDGRPRRSRRARQHALQDLDPPGAEARPEGRAGRRGLAPPRAAADRRHRARRAAERGQVDDPRGGDRGDAQDRRLPVHDARAEPRGHGPRRRGRAATDDRRRARASSRAPAAAPVSATPSCATSSGRGSSSTSSTARRATPSGTTT